MTAAGHGGTLTRWAVSLAPGLPPLERLAWLLAGFALLTALRGLVLWRRDLLLARLQIGFVENLRARLAQGLANARWQCLAEIGHGRVTHLMGGDIQRCGAGAHFLFQSAVALVMLAGLGLLALLLSPLLTAIAAVLLLAGAVALFALNRQAGDVGRRVTGANLALMTGLGQFLGGIKLAISQNLQSHFVRAFERDLDASVRSQASFVGQQAMLRGLWGLLAAVVAGVTLLLGFGWLGLPAPVLIAFLVVLARASAPALQIQLGIQQIAYSLPAWDAVETMRKDLVLAETVQRAVRGHALAGPIVLDNVSYRHGAGLIDGPGDDPGDGPREFSAGVDGISLRLMPGEMVGIAGPSGAGKTTLVDLLAGLLLPGRGSIAIGGVVLDEANAAQWRERIAYVAQDPYLFNDSIRANLLWSCPAASEDELAQALALAGAEDLIAGLPAGLDTRMGEKGALVSGGERQRLALARALLRRPQLLILDEATSAIDPAGERAVLERLGTLAPRPIIVMIAHRHESLARCDRLLRVDAGRLVSDRRAGVAA